MFSISFSLISGLRYDFMQLRYDDEFMTVFHFSDDTLNFIVSAYDFSVISP